MPLNTGVANTNTAVPASMHITARNDSPRKTPDELLRGMTSAAGPVIRTAPCCRRTLPPRWRYQ